MHFAFKDLDPIHYGLVVITAALVTAIIIVIIQRDVIDLLKFENEKLKDIINNFKRRAAWSSSIIKSRSDIHNKSTVAISILSERKDPHDK